MKKAIIGLLVIINSLMLGCKEELPIKGCMDESAMNFDPLAEESCCCHYGDVIFYASTVSALPITVTTSCFFIPYDLGTISLAYSSLPPDCDAVGCAKFQFRYIANDSLHWCASGNNFSNAGWVRTSSNACTYVKVD